MAPGVIIYLGLPKSDALPGRASSRWICPVTENRKDQVDNLSAIMLIV
jgi:hypothetical protein